MNIANASQLNFLHLPLIPKQNQMLTSPPPEPIRNPEKGDCISLGGNHPFEPSIIDFRFDQSTLDSILCSHQFDLKKILDFGPKPLMQKVRKENNQSPMEPELRWIHLPYNSMKDAEDLIKVICKSCGLGTELAEDVILRGDRWRDKLHRQYDGDDYYARFMQTYCSEISFTEEIIAHPKSARDRFGHKGANLVLFMPFLHWGKQEILRWRKEKITTVEENQNKPIAKQKPVCDPKDSTMRRFYADLMQRQLFCNPPLHIRRTLDQYYYTHMRDTSARDNDQVVSKYGKGGKLEGSPETNHKTSAVMRHGGRCTWLRTQEKDGGLGEGNEEGQNHTILMVDQLWLWILGSETVLTCFDRRWEEHANARANVFDNVVWKLMKSGQAHRIKSAYDLANLIIDEASSFFFHCIDDDPESLHFSELFRKAIGAVSERQIRQFAHLEKLSRGRPLDLNRKEQNQLFDVSEDFELVSEVRDIIDELNIIEHVYREQTSITSALSYAQYHHFLFIKGFTDHHGDHKVNLEALAALADSTPSTPTIGPLENGSAPYSEGFMIRDTRKKLQQLRRQCECDPLPDIDFDSRDWLKRTTAYMVEHHKGVQEMLEEVSRVYQAVQDTINLKQNNGSLFEAHATRCEGEAIMLFTLVTSIFLPLSFFASIFSMNVIEINPSSKITLGRAMAWGIPLSLAIISLLLMGVWNRTLREFSTDVFAVRGTLREKVRKGLGDKHDSNKRKDSDNGNECHAVNGVAHTRSTREYDVEDGNGQTGRQECDMV